MRRGLAAISTLALAGALLAGCTDLAAVTDISTRLRTASATWDDVGGEFLASCERERRANPLPIDCAEQARASAGLAGANAVLQGYFTALRDAASGTSFTLAPGLDEAAAAVAGVPGIDAARAQAASGLVGLLAQVGTEALRERTLRRLIDDGGSPAQMLVEALDPLVTGSLTTRLETERARLSGTFAGRILAQRDAIPAAPASTGATAEARMAALCTGSGSAGFGDTGYLLAAEYCRQAAVLDRREKALAEYRVSLARAREALVVLQSNKARLKAAETVRRLVVLGAELDASVSAVRRAFA